VQAVPETPVKRYTTLLALILAGEIIFSLPFHIPRFFRPTLLDVFQLTNTQLGDIFALYGVVALLAYFPGGAIADRFQARTLIAVSLVATALGGFYLYTLPDLIGLYLVFAYWGLTSILLFWAALIKATRDWGGQQTQGLAFGVLEGGRGVIASVLALSRCSC
jgi:predicted MFS family arabinose efflux permease